MSTNDTLPSQDEVQRRARRKRWIIVIVIICLLSVLCVLAFCILGVLAIVDSTKPKTNAALYQDASISHMVETCKPERYYSPEEWMLPIPGAHTVTAIHYSKSSPAPDAYYAYDFYIQLEPELLKAGQELTFPSDGIVTFLLETRAPYLVCESDLQGTITIQEYTPNVLKALLDVYGTVDRYTWEYNGEVEFNLSPLPVMGVEEANCTVCFLHALPE